MSIFGSGGGGRGSLATVQLQPQPHHTVSTEYGMPDFNLSSLQNRIQIKDLEHLYKRYEQRAQIGE